MAGYSVVKTVFKGKTYYKLKRPNGSAAAYYTTKSKATKAKQDAENYKAKGGHKSLRKR